MPINFPASPSNNQSYSYGGQSWYWANNIGVWQPNNTSVGVGNSQIFTSNGSANITISSSINPPDAMVVLNGLVLVPNTDYTISNTTLTFTTAPANGDNIEVRTFQGLGGGSSSGGGGSLTLANVVSSNTTASANTIYPVSTSSGAVYITLPASPTNGQQVMVIDYSGYASANNIIVNPNGNKVGGSTSNVTMGVSRQSLGLIYTDSTQGWLPFGTFTTSPLQYTVEFLLIGGGGGGGSDWGGGGGAGGYLTGSSTVYPGSSYSITIGAGGSGGPNVSTQGSDGSNTVGFSVTALGGGGGGSDGVDNGRSGASGGGGAIDGTGGSGTVGQGSAGANGNRGNSLQGGGGGGSSQAGQNQAGGNGTQWVNGTTYAGGGGGARNGSTGTGGTGGGGTGGNSGSGATAGTANLGGGGGANNSVGMNGGSGTVIVRYLGPQKAAGGTVTSANGYTYHTFTTSGTYIS